LIRNLIGPFQNDLLDPNADPDPGIQRRLEFKKLKQLQNLIQKGIFDFSMNNLDTFL